MKALFIGHSYIDVTFLTDALPSGDEKTVAHKYVTWFGGNAVNRRRRLARPRVHRHGGEVWNLGASQEASRAPSLYPASIATAARKQITKPACVLDYG